MSYRKHGFWVLIERCFKQTAMKYFDDSIKLSPYRQFCCPLSLISALSSANIPVSPWFFGEFDVLTRPPFWKTTHFQFFSFPVLRSQLENLLKPLSQWFGYPRVLGIPMPKSLVKWVSRVGIPKTLILCTLTKDWKKRGHSAVYLHYLIQTECFYYYFRGNVLKKSRK